MVRNLIIQYTNLLHKHGLGSKASEEFRKKYESDSVFQNRAKKLNQLFAMSKDIEDI